MPGLLRTGAQLGNAAAAAAAAAARCAPLATSSGLTGSYGIWSQHRDCITFDQLQKFWSGLPYHARQELLKIDKQMLFELARKNLYCSRCNGLLLEVFSQIVMYGKSLHQEGGVMYPPRKAGDAERQVDGESDGPQDPYIHPWGGLVATRDGILTLLDCFIYGQSLQVLQNVFDSARVRERERELLYPDACGGGGRGWISQSMATYSRGHGTRETCALHTARLSCDTLVDFWSALGDETHLSLLSMKEEDFIERLMYRFDSKRFCRDCRRNVIREFKELKELKRMRREPRCTNWFCVADTAFQYEVSADRVQADWHQYFTDSVGTYHHFEWAIGTGEGKSDILEFEDVGMNGEVQASGLDLGGLSACFITLRAWRLDGRCTELIVKAHALKGQPCVHRRLMVGDGYVTITQWENIRRFFEHAEEAEEEEDDDSIEKDGNEVDDDGFRPQKHAKSPELAREFLLDAAAVIFKEQVEKAFREGTARQNAHSTFVCLALKLLEERVLVACKEIITWEKQIKLLEEEEKEKREEEERKERRRMKEREKKMRRKERLKEKERERERKNIESKSLPAVLPSRPTNESSMSTTNEQPNILDSEDSLGMAGDMSPSRSDSSDTVDEYSIACVGSEICAEGGSPPFILEQSTSSRQKSRFKNSLPEIASKLCDKRLSASGNEDTSSHDVSEKIFHPYVMASSRCMNGDHRQLRGNVLKTNARNYGPKFNDKFHCSDNRVCDRYDFRRCGFNQHGDYKAKDGQCVSKVRSDREIKIVDRTETFDTRRPCYQRGKYGHGCFMPENFIISRGKFGTGGSQRSRGDARHMTQIWEPMDSQKKCFRGHSDPDSASTPPSKTDTEEAGYRVENGCEAHGDSVLKGTESPDVTCPSGDSANTVKTGAIDPYQCEENSPVNVGCKQFGLGVNSGYYSKTGASKGVGLCPVVASALSMNSSRDPLTSSSSSENCSSYLSEGDSSTSSSSTQSTESSSISDSEDASQQSEGRDMATCIENAFEDSQHDSVVVVVSKSEANGVVYSPPTAGNLAGFPVTNRPPANFPRVGTTEVVCGPDDGLGGYDVAPQQQPTLPMHPAACPPPAAMGYGNQCRVPWTALPGNHMVSSPQPSQQYVLHCPVNVGHGLPVYPPSPDFSAHHYNALLQPLVGPVVNVGQLPPCRSPDKAADGNTTTRLNQQSHGQHGNINRSSGRTQGGGAREAAVRGVRPLPHPTSRRRLSPIDGGTAGPAKSHSDGPSFFSLFHFGGPMAVAAGCHPDSARPGAAAAESNRGFPSDDSPEGPADHDSGGMEESKIEEYSLFASGGNAIFPFFPAMSF